MTARKVRPVALVIAVALGLMGGCSATGGSLPDGSATGRSNGSVEWLPTADPALPGRAEQAYRERRWADAVALYSELSERMPHDAHAWFRLGNAHSRQGAFDRAVIAYRAAIERDARDPRPWFNLSTALLMNAQHSMTRAWAALPPGDPMRLSIEARLFALAELVQASAEPPPARRVGDVR